MLYLSGCVRPDLPEGMGTMHTPDMGNLIPDGRRFAVDTGCFNNPDAYSTERYLFWLWERRAMADRCLFATAPDVFGDGPATLKASRRVLPLIRCVGFPAALVLQPGVTVETVPWDAVDAVFIGGPNDWHDGPEVDAIVREAKRRGLWTHEGRVNTLSGLMRARQRGGSGVDSIDGTYIAFGPDINGPKMARWVAKARAQLPFDWEAA